MVYLIKKYASEIYTRNIIVKEDKLGHLIGNNIIFNKTSFRNQFLES